MKRSGPMLACAAIFAGLAAGSAAAAEPAELQFASGTLDGKPIRVVAGEVDGRGVVYVEYYDGARLVYTLPFTRVFIDDEETNVRRLTELQLRPTQTGDGFDFTAQQGSTALACTILIHVAMDYPITCTRGTGYVPPGAPACARAFKGTWQRQQCNGIREAFAGKGFDDDAIVDACVATYCDEFARNDCIMYAYNHPADFEPVRSACLAAMETEGERRLCFFGALAVEPERRIRPADIRTCGTAYDDDKLVTLCALSLRDGRSAAEVLPARPPTLAAHEQPTTAVTVGAATGAVSGAILDVSTGQSGTDATRVTGGMVGTAPILWVDVYKSTGELSFTNQIDRVIVGRKKVSVALRSLDLVEDVRATGELVTFKATREGKRLTCRANMVESWATCR